MRQYDLLRPAQLDILALVEYAAEYTEQARDTLTDTLFDCFERIAEFPGLGRWRGELADGLRSFSVRQLKVTIFYYPTPEGGDRVIIARVLRQERDTRPEMFGGAAE